MLERLSKTFPTSTTIPSPLRIPLRISFLSTNILHSSQGIHLHFLLYRPPNLMCKLLLQQHPAFPRHSSSLRTVPPAAPHISYFSRLYHNCSSTTDVSPPHHADDAHHPHCFPCHLILSSDHTHPTHHRPQSRQSVCLVVCCPKKTQ